MQLNGLIKGINISNFLKTFRTFESLLKVMRFILPGIQRIRRDVCFCLFVRGEETSFIHGIIHGNKEKTFENYKISPYGINLPCGMNMTEETVGYVCAVLKSVLGRG